MTPKHRRRPRNRPSCASICSTSSICMQMPDRDKRIVALLIDALDDDGYLTQDLDELAALLPAELEIDAEDLHHRAASTCKTWIRPASARATSANAWRCNWKRCRKTRHTETKRSLVVTQPSGRFRRARLFRELKKLLHCDDDVLRAIQKLIIGLNPRPGGEFLRR